MLSITFAILALYTIELAKMAAQPRVAYVVWATSICLALAAAFFAPWREILREG